jgi:histidine triad (HIT) family protein
MYNHAPEGYVCPFCRIVREADLSNPACDVVYKTETVTAFLGPGRWEKNPLDVLVVPNAHVENLYGLQLDLAPDLHVMTRAIALAVKDIFHCHGVSTRQHNEPAGDQDVWHYHIHVTPRFAVDNFYKNHKVTFPESERLDSARKIREYFDSYGKTLLS